MMRVTVKIYDLNELTPEAKVKAIEYFRHDFADNEYSLQYIIDNWRVRLSNMGIENPTIRYSGFDSQGDGASFIGLITEPIKFCKIHKIKMNMHFILAFTGKNKCDITVRPIGIRYVHEKSITLNHESYYTTNDDAVEDVIDSIHYTCIKMNRQIYEELYKEYLYMLSDEYVEENILCNSYMFFDSGKHIPHELYMAVNSIE